jgi:HEAT repeat protein
MPLFGPPNIKKLETNRDVNGLIKALTYRQDEDIRRKAAFALGALGDSLAVPALVTALDDPADWVRWSAAYALARMGDRRCVPTLITALGSKQHEESAIDALAMLRDARAIDPLIAVMNAKDNPERTAAADALGNMPDARVFDALIQAMTDPDWLLKIQARKSLERIAAVFPERLIAALDHTEDYVRSIAARLLGDLGTRDAEGKLMAMLMNSPFSSERRVAADSLEKLGWQPGEDETGAAFWAGKGDWEKCIQLGRKDLALEPMIYALSDDSTHRVQAAVTAIVKLGDANAAQHLVPLLNNKWNFIRKQVIAALGSLRNPVAVDPLITILQGNDSFEAADAAKALGEIGDPRAVDPLITALHSYSGESEAAAALVKFYRSGQISEIQKNAILQHKDKITNQRHRDYHDDGDCPKGHTDMGVDIFSL